LTPGDGSTKIPTDQDFTKATSLTVFLWFMPPFAKDWILLRPAPPVTAVEALSGKTPKAFVPRAEKSLADAWSYDGEYVLARAKNYRILVTTHLCDIEHRSFIQVAPVYPASAISPDKQNSLRANEIRYMFYLPSSGELPESYADLSQATPVHNSYLRGRGVLARLTPVAMTELQTKIAALQGREFGFNTDDTVLEEADYLCANCFFSKATIQRQRLTVGPFPTCPSCGNDVLWVKFFPSRAT
jgi:hypothetical protein